MLSGALVGCAYWVASFARFNPEPLFTKLLYRFGDLQYYPFIDSLSRLNFKPTYSPVFTTGTGIMQFPLAAFTPHALGFAAAGVPGFAIVDIVVGAVAAYIVYCLLRVASAPKALAAVLAILFICSSFIPYFYHLLYVQIYAFKVPRPYVTNIYFLLFLAFSLSFFLRSGAFVTSKRGGLRLIAFGIVTALVLQSSVYLFIDAAGVLLFLAGYSILKSKIGFDRSAMWAGLYFAVPFCLFALPFVLQSLWGEPDQAVRFGVYTVENRWPVVVGAFNEIAGPIFGFTVFSTILVYLTKRFGGSYRVAVFAFALPLVSAAAQMAFLVFSPRYVQIGHNTESVLLALAICEFLEVPVLYSVIIRFRPFGLVANLFSGRVRNAMAAVCSVILVAFTYNYFYKSVKSIQVMVEKHFSAPDPAQFRNDLNTIMKAIGADPRKAGLRLLLTNDDHVYTWWVMSHQGTLLMPDVFSVVLKDDQIEAQLVQAGKYFGWSVTQWSAFLNQDVIENDRIRNTNLVFFHSCGKYEASIIRTWKGQMDYPPPVLAAIANTEWWSSTSVALPISERERLNKLYTETSRDPRFAPDVIVYAKYKGVPPADPPSNYRLILDLANYIVWKR